MPDIFVNPANSSTALGGDTIPVHPVRGMFSSFLTRPDGVRFETQAKDEEIILFLRQHFVVNVPWIVALVTLLFIPIVLGSRLLPLIPNLPPQYPVILALFWYVGTLGFFLVNFLHWYFNIYIVTNQRVIDIDFVSLLYKEISDANLGHIEDVTYKEGGFIRSFFDYGDVVIQTAGTQSNFEFQSVAHPNEVVRIIDGLIEEHHR